MNFVSTGTEVDAAKAVAAAKEALEIEYAEDDSANNITKALTLPTTDKDVTITWESSDSHIKKSGEVVRPSYSDGDLEVTLTATITSTKDTSVKDTKEFNVVVKANVAGEGDLLLVAVNSAKTTKEMKDAIEKNEGLDLKVYNELAGIQKDAAANELLDNAPFKTVEEIQNALNAYIGEK